jgi:hypothetical protein
MQSNQVRFDISTVRSGTSFQGEIEGKRVGSTENIGARARSSRLHQNLDAQVTYRASVFF